MQEQLHYSRKARRNTLHTLNYVTPKKWSPRFAEMWRPFEKPWLQYRQQICGDSSNDELERFLEYGSKAPSCMIEDVLHFCQQSMSTYSNPGIRRGAWLDDRALADQVDQVGRTTKSYREYELPLTAAKLCKHLKESRFDHTSKPDADKRLLYIADLDAHYISALVKTADMHQVEPLTDGMWKHITLQTSLGVRLNRAGFTTFHLEFHMPYYALRTYAPREKLSGNRTWRDCSWLINSFPGTSQDGSLGIYTAHISIFICGSSEKQWRGYCFEDCSYDSNRELDVNDFSYDEGPNVDPIVGYSGCEFKDANMPFWNPRTYYLTAMLHRVEQICNEWIGMVHTIEQIIHGYTNGDASIPKVSGPILKENEEMVQTFEWTHRSLRLIRQLLENVNKINAAWSQFMSPTGDILYFEDMDLQDETYREYAERCLSEISKKFDELGVIQQRLENLERRLGSLEQQCQASAQVLQLRLSLENNKAAKLNTSMSAMMVVAISPVALVSAFFAIPQPIFSFERNTASFVISLLAVAVGLHLLLYKPSETFEEVGKLVTASGQQFTFMFSWLLGAIPDDTRAAGNSLRMIASALASVSSMLQRTKITVHIHWPGQVQFRSTKDYTRWRATMGLFRRFLQGILAGIATALAWARARVQASSVRTHKRWPANPRR